MVEFVDEKNLRHFLELHAAIKEDQGVRPAGNAILLQPVPDDRHKVGPIRYTEEIALRLHKATGIDTADSVKRFSKGRRIQLYKTAFVTSLPVAKSNVAEIAACGRARWKIENEGFNVLKNNGYELEHNFGHGETNLAMTLAALNLLAFAWHTVLDLLEPPWRKAREAAEKRTSFFAYLATLTTLAVFPAWSDLLEALATFIIPPHLLTTQKNE